MKIMVLGDTHGNTKWTERVVKHAARHKANKIIQVGDFGLWDHFEDGVKYLDTLNEALRRDGTKLYAVGGNHENWIRWNWYIENNPKDTSGFTILRSHIRIAPKTHTWSWAISNDPKDMRFKRFAIAGGAVSIDRQWRLENEKKRNAPNTQFWWDEQLLDADVEAFPERKVDYLFTHDCSNRTPFWGRLKPDFESQMHRQRIDEVLKKSMPNFHFHGHMHNKYDWMNRISGDHFTQTYGLECDGMFWSWGILDTDSDEFVFVPNIPRTEPKEIEKESILEGEVCQ